MEILITIVIVSLGWFIFYKVEIHRHLKKTNALETELNNQIVNRDYEINHQVNEKVEPFNNQILELRKQLIDVERESYFKGKKQAEDSFANDFSVQVFPYKRHFRSKKNYLIGGGDKEMIEVGFQYQLFVKGCPTFEPKLEILETYEQKQFKLDEEAIKLMVNSAIGNKTELLGGIIKIANRVLLKKGV